MNYRKFKQKQKRKRGLTLIELIVVLIIIGSIMAIVIRQLVKGQGDANRKVNQLKMQTDYAQISTALLDYSRVYGNVPDSSEGLEALVNPPETDSGGSHEPFLSKEAILDPWKHPYAYEKTDTGYKIVSLGADGTIGGEGVNADIDLSSIIH